MRPALETCTLTQDESWLQERTRTPSLEVGLTTLAAQIFAWTLLIYNFQFKSAFQPRSTIPAVSLCLSACLTNQTFWPMLMVYIHMPQVWDEWWVRCRTLYLHSSCSIQTRRVSQQRQTAYTAQGTQWFHTAIRMPGNRISLHYYSNNNNHNNIIINAFQYL